MPEVIRIVGIEGGHLSRPPGTVPFDVNMCPDGTLRLGNVPDGHESPGFPITLKARDLSGEIHLEDSSGRLVLSWLSSINRATQPSNMALADDPVSPPPSQQIDSNGRRSISANTVDASARLSHRSVLSTTEAWAARSTKPPASSLRPTTRASRLRTAQPHIVARNQRTFMLKQLRSLIYSHRDSEIFNNPVDTVQYPDYSKTIKSPMDFHTIHRNYKSSRSYYPIVDAIMADFNLVIENAINYNGARHEISQRARNIKSWFEERMKRLPAPEGARKRKTPCEEGNNTVQRELTRGTSLRSVVQSVELASSLPSNDTRVCRETVQPTPQPKRLRHASYDTSSVEEIVSNYSE